MDYVHAFSRDMLISRGAQSQPAQQHDGRRVDARAPGSDVLRAATLALQQQYANFANFSAGVSIPVNDGDLDYDAILLAFEKRFSSNFSSRVVVHATRTRAVTTPARAPASGFQVLDDLHLDLNEGRTGRTSRTTSS